jgi:hypothetical protein
VRDGDMEDVSALIDVNLYSFLSLMGGTTLEEATPKMRFRVARDMGLAAMVHTVGELAGPSGLGLSAQGYFQAARAPAATLYLYQEKTQSWRPLVRIMFFLSFLVCDLSIYRSITACLHSLTPPGTSLTIIPPSLNRHITYYHTGTGNPAASGLARLSGPGAGLEGHVQLRFCRGDR